MTVKELLQSKGSEVITMESDSTVESAIKTMTNRKISAILITEKGKPVGIFTERDVLKAYIITEGKPFAEIPLKDAMTSDLIVAEPSDDLCTVMSIMIEKSIRHMPVAEKERIIGILSIRDIVKTQVGKLQSEIHYLKDYITGF
jgi:CBS domain-containing protein